MLHVLMCARVNTMKDYVGAGVQPTGRAWTYCALGSGFDSQLQKGLEEDCVHAEP